MPAPPLDQKAIREAEACQARLTKPTGSLGRLEELSIRLAGMTGRLDPPLRDAVVFTLAADHGVAAEGVSAYPREVTAQMVLNFLRGGAAINVLAREVGARVVVADIGVDAELPAHPDLHAVKVRRGTASITRGPAMSRREAEQAIDVGRALVGGDDPDVALTGDMGIGNTTASAAIICALTGLDPRDVVGRGTGVDDTGLERKSRRGVARARGQCAVDRRGSARGARRSGRAGDRRARGRDPRERGAAPAGDHRRLHLGSRGAGRGGD